MDTLIYDNFVDIALNLPLQDLLSLCSTNREYNGFCKRPNFYRDLILRKYNLDIPGATYKDYRFVSELEEIKLVPPSPSIFEDNFTKTYDEVIKEAQELLDLYSLTELQAYLGGQPIRYFTYPPDFLHLINKHDRDRLNGLWFTAYTPEGALLKFKDLYGELNQYGDYLSFVTFFSGKFPPDLRVATIGSLSHFSNNDFPELVETKRPYIDYDPDGSKLRKGRDELIKASRDKRYYFFSYKSSFTGYFIASYDKEINTNGPMRYFIIKPKILLGDINSYDYTDYQSFSGLVIAARSPEGAMLRLAGLVPAFRKRLFFFLGGTYTDEAYLIRNIMLTSDMIDRSTSDEVVLVEINQPHII